MGDSFTGKHLDEAKLLIQIYNLKRERDELVAKMGRLMRLVRLSPADSTRSYRSTSQRSIRVYNRALVAVLKVARDAGWQPDEDDNVSGDVAGNR